MSERDASFEVAAGLDYAVELLRDMGLDLAELPASCPEDGLGERDTLSLLAPHVLGGAARLDRADALAHMDPPTPWITWAMALWNARLNQNLLHPATAPFALDAEKRVLDWLTPFFGMGGGHFCSGSTLANLTAIWAARDARGAKRVVASEAAHVSVSKSARLLNLPFESIPIDGQGRLDASKLGDVQDACLVLTAGTTACGDIDALDLAGRARWTHVDAAWAGPLRLSDTHAHLLDGIEKADSVAVSAHKWLFQPKDSALVMFRQPDIADPAISVGGGYLAAPNVGVQGSRGAAAIPLLALLVAWGRRGVARRIDRTMEMAAQFARRISSDDGIVLLRTPTTAITVFRATALSTHELHRRLPHGMLSTCTLLDTHWLRSVAANPNADVEQIVSAINGALNQKN